MSLGDQGESIGGGNVYEWRRTSREGRETVGASAGLCRLCGGGVASEGFRRGGLLLNYRTTTLEGLVKHVGRVRE